jgi:hypothetical protein
MLHRLITEALVLPAVENSVKKLAENFCVAQLLFKKMYH